MRIETTADNTRANRLLLLLFVLIILLCVALSPAAQPAADGPAPSVQITEILPHNKTIVNADGRLCGYVKLTNTGDTDADLSGWGLSDRPYKIRFMFPSLQLAPGESAFVFLSGANTLYTGQELYAGFSVSSSGEIVTLFDASGAVVDSVTVPALADDEAYALTNGTWQAVFTPSFSQSADAMSAAQLFISEVMTANATYAFGEEQVVCDYVELCNAGDQPVSLADYALTDDIGRLERLIFPDGMQIPAGDTFLILFTAQSVTGSNLYAADAFGLSDQGETLSLVSRSQRQIIDQVEVPALEDDQAYTRLGQTWSSGEAPTPRFENTAWGQAAVDAQLRLGNASGVFISEVLSSNLSTDLPGVTGHYDYIELYNAGSAPVALSGFTLTDNPNQPRKWTFGDLTLPAGGYALVYCEPDNLSLATQEVIYAGFRLSAGGESVYLYAPDGTLLDRMNVPSLFSDSSYGRTLGENGLFYYSVPTPGAANAGGVAGYSETPTTSAPGGLYERPVCVTLSAPDGAAIYYTLDGSDPDASCTLYTQPLLLEQTSTLRACSVSDGLAPSPALTQTYFISTYHTLPVIALTTDPDNLWNEEDGMLADGPLLDRQTQSRPWTQATYWKKTKNAGYIEYYGTDGEQLLSQGLIFHCMGQFSLDMPQKSFSLEANSQFGADAFDVAAFSDRPYTRYAAFALRNGGQDGLYTRVLDGLQARLAEQCGTTVITQAWQPVIVYLNGEYWGHYNLRERVGVEMIAQHEGWLYPERIDLLEGNGTGSGNVNNGSNAAYRELVEYVNAHDLAAEPDALAHVLSQVDLDNMIDYFFFEMFYGNTDPGNIRFYRSAVEGDGKWRYLLYDLDWGLYDSASGGPAYVLNPEGMGRYRFTSNVLIVRLLEVPEIRDRFLSRAGTLFQTVFTTENMIALLDDMVVQIEPEMSMHFERWGDKMYPQLSLDQPKNAAGAYAYWQQRVERARNVMKKRPTLFWAMVKEHFALSDEEMLHYFGPCPVMPADAI